MRARRLGRYGLAVVLGLAGLVALPGPAVADTPTLNVGDVAIWEGDSGKAVATIIVTLSEPSLVDTTITYQLNTTATPGVDFRSPYYMGDPPKQVTISAGSVRKPFRIQVFGDTAVEGDETVEFEILSADAAIGDGSGVITIRDDDPGVANRLAVGDASVHEGDLETRIVVIPVTLSQPAAGALAVTITTADATATGSTIGVLNDYRPRARTLTLSVGRQAKYLSVPVYPDLDAEGDETFTVTVSTTDPSVTVTDAVGVATIVDDD
jgi:hypothetical protein